MHAGERLPFLRRLALFRLGLRVLIVDVDVVVGGSNVVVVGGIISETNHLKNQPTAVYQEKELNDVCEWVWKKSTLA